MTWQDRLKPTITLTSPDGDFFEPKWRGNPRNFTKKLGIFNYPKLKGSIVQDLEVNSDQYALTLHFDGPDNDQEAERFSKSCKQSGLWEIDHPTKGKKLLQLVDLTENIESIENGNITTFDTNWIEPITDQVVSSDKQLENEIVAAVEEINDAATTQFQQVKLDTFSKIAAIKTAIGKAVSFVTAATAAVSATIAAVEAQQAAIVRGIQDTLDAVVLEPLKLAAQMQNLVQLPGLITGAFQDRFSMYSTIIDDIFDLTPEDDDSSEEALNTILTQELVLSAVAAIVPVVGATSTFTVRSESLLAIDTITEQFNTITTGLDDSQNNFTAVFIENQYFSQSQSYNLAVQSIGLSNQLLLQRTFDLTAARTILLKQPKTPARITIEEYGSLDDKLDLFISSNNLSGNDILWLPAGREVIVYG